MVRNFIELSEQYGCGLVLEADESDDGASDDSVNDEDFRGFDESEHWLQSWYSRLGFDYTGESGDYGPMMRREPNAIS